MKTIVRALAMLLVALLLATPFACGPRGYADSPEAQACQTVLWGGWNGTPECAGIAAVVISPRDRICQSDEDCVIVGTNGCAAHSVNKPAAANAGRHPPPCTHPLAGMCRPTPWVGKCQQGCCTPTASR